jgi:hypothetical protein
MKPILAFTKRSVPSGWLTALATEVISQSILILAMIVILGAVLLTARGVEWLFPHTARAVLKVLHSCTGSFQGSANSKTRFEYR